MTAIYERAYTRAVRRAGRTKPYQRSCAAIGRPEEASTSRPCPKAGCYQLQPCTVHPRAPFSGAKQSSDLYNTPRWKQERAQHLAAEPMCRNCGAPAIVVDHQRPHRGDEAAFWDRSNWVSLCRPCHDSKTGREAKRVQEGGRFFSTPRTRRRR